ncbi:hypothetical protein SASPL_157922 [Salvia splendens]|uniref:Solute carrier family 39 (Zinc transporter), member 1/2/3 n=1 Tax=Salvia splendens TaxID=180675 RepID=A0A8X8VU44_SALSN|nr:hypothetical protein SASPL_157922 [Salvia splendens]
MSSKFILIPFTISLLILATLPSPAESVVADCGGDAAADGCTDKKKALPLKIIAIVSILVTSMIGVCLPLITRSVPALSPERSLFVIVKAFAAGIILATGFMHVLPDSFDMLSSDCLKENPWHKFPFTGFVAMLSAIVTLMIDSMATRMGLGGCILQAEYNFVKKAAMAFFFSVTTPFGIALGIALSSMYKEDSPRSLITVGLLNASSAGLLIYMALVDLLASDFMGPKLQGSIKLQLKSYAAVLLGAGGMSLMAKWA